MIFRVLSTSFSHAPPLQPISVKPDPSRWTCRRNWWLRQESMQQTANFATCGSLPDHLVWWMECRRRRTYSFSDPNQSLNHHAMHPPVECFVLLPRGLGLTEQWYASLVVMSCWWLWNGNCGLCFRRTKILCGHSGSDCKSPTLMLQRQYLLSFKGNTPHFCRMLSCIVVNVHEYVFSHLFIYFFILFFKQKKERTF